MYLNTLPILFLTFFAFNVSAEKNEPVHDHCTFTVEAYEYGSGVQKSRNVSCDGDVIEMFNPEKIGTKDGEIHEQWFNLMTWKSAYNKRVENDKYIQTVIPMMEERFGLKVFSITGNPKLSFSIYFN